MNIDRVGHRDRKREIERERVRERDGKRKIEERKTERLKDIESSCFVWRLRKR